MKALQENYNHCCIISQKLLDCIASHISTKPSCDRQTNNSLSVQQLAMLTRDNKNK